MSLGMNLKGNLTELKFGKDFKKSTWSLSKLFFMLLSLMLGLTWQFNAFAQELDYADKSGRAAEIIKKSEQYQSFLTLQQKMAEENGDRVRKFEVAVDGVNAKIINEDLRIVKNGPLKTPYIRTERKKRTFELYNNFVLLDENGKIKFLVLDIEYKKEVELVSDFFEYDESLIGLSFKKYNEKNDDLNLIGLRSLQFLSIRNMKIGKIIFPHESALISVELFLTDINSISNLDELNELESFEATNLLFDNIDEISNSKKLKSLNVSDSNNRISKLPDLSFFKDLEYLAFNSKYIKKALGLESLLKLKFLSVGSNFNFQNISFPDSIEEMYLSGIDNTKMPDLKGNKKLRILSISRTKITKVEGLNDLENLEIFSLARNEIEGISGLEKLKIVKELNLLGNNIKKIEGISNLKNLEKIDLQYNEIEKIEGFENLPHLQSILLGHNKINKIDSVNFMTWLDVLSLHHNPIDTFDYQSIAGLENTKVIIRDTPLSDILTDEVKEKYYDMHRYLRF